MADHDLLPARLSRDRLAPRAGAPFARMNGVGNVILVVDLRGREDILSGADAQRIAAMQGFAFDQLMAIHDATEPGTDAILRIYNVDGSLAGACGNGTRCVAWFMMRGDKRQSLVLATGTSNVTVTRVAEQDFAVDMGAPSFDPATIPLRSGSDPRALALGLAEEVPFGAPVAIGMGNPHGVFFVADVDAVDLPAYGPRIEYAPAFPDRANISFAQVLDRDTIKLRVWERGAGATLGCGTGACATLVAAAITGRTGRRANVHLPGGMLGVEWRESDGHVVMTGPVAIERMGTLDLSMVSDASAQTALEPAA